MASDSYSFKPGGSLKFKGGDTVSSGGKSKKRKSKSSSHPSSSHQATGASSSAGTTSHKASKEAAVDDREMLRLMARQAEQEEEEDDNGNDNELSQLEDALGRRSQSNLDKVRGKKSSTSITGTGLGLGSSGGGGGARKLTDAEKRFEEVQKKRRQDKIRKEATKSHKEKVADFNKYLEALSEHHDLPKVGPG